jgi:type II secretory pathway pseudopilin PulG
VSRIPATTNTFTVTQPRPHPHRCRESQNYTLANGGTPQSLSAGSYAFSLAPNSTTGCSRVDDISPSGLCVLTQDTQAYSRQAAPKGAGNPATDGAALLPKTNRQVQSAVFDPTGDKLAFLSPNPTDATSLDLFTVASSGGEPTQVAGKEAGLAKGATLIAWRSPT